LQPAHVIFLAADVGMLVDQEPRPWPGNQVCRQLVESVPVVVRR
jgi:hypothetical protein